VAARRRGRRRAWGWWWRPAVAGCDNDEICSEGKGKGKEEKKW
jgi:hypothetical protein